ncbi:hypothetical protein FXB40_23850 [Bradyrhizobium rifense]|uniref:Uncharacterized protein n=1 Tax=Bradyrhizobium rifense TaxID=515499 RepID=A0A5D3K9Z8_9BRAD|nr:hypothetical protein [Bradyrhizobium rifense]TYL92728.1 hypothetical protein FXB40_23850 [Bradyrhizobium rifense]
MTESNFSKELKDAVALRKVGYEQMEKLASKIPTRRPLSLDEPLSANKSLFVATAFWLDPKWEQHQKVLDAFERFQLNPQNPWHWRLFIEAFIEVGLKGPGPKTKTVANKYSQLPEHIDELKREDPNLTSATEIARRLISGKRFKKRYAHITLRTLRSHVRALDWGSLEDNLREIRKAVTENVASKPTKTMRR